MIGKDKIVIEIMDGQVSMIHTNIDVEIYVVDYDNIANDTDGTAAMNAQECLPITFIAEKIEEEYIVNLCKEVKKQHE